MTFQDEPFEAPRYNLIQQTVTHSNCEGHRASEHMKTSELKMLLKSLPLDSTNIPLPTESICASPCAQHWKHEHHPCLEEALSPSAAPDTTSSGKLNNRSTMEKKVIRRVQASLLEEVGSDRRSWTWCIL